MALHPVLKNLKYIFAENGKKFHCVQLDLLGHGSFGVIKKVNLVQSEHDETPLPGTPHALKIFDGGYDIGYVFKLDMLGLRLQSCLIMELCDKGTLEEFLVKNPPSLSVSRILDFTSQMAKALGYLHNHSDQQQEAIFHGDLKPANVMLTGTDNTPVLKLVGLDSFARLKDKQTDRSEMKTKMGTIRYVSGDDCISTVNEPISEVLIDAGIMSPEFRYWYDWEVPRDSICLRRAANMVLGRGHFGIVRRGFVTNLHGQPGETVVAVKTLRNPEDAVQRTSLLNEIKIMSYVGRHLNVVNLLGTVTQNTARAVPMQWTAIELLTGGAYSEKSDMWSYGVLLWEIFTLGGKPYPGFPTEYRPFVNALQAGSRMERPPQAPQEIYSIMWHCWEDNLKSRPSFDSLSAKLLLFLESYSQQQYLELNTINEHYNLIHDSSFLNYPQPKQCLRQVRLWHRY
ncbi:putative Fibroblast growth factor receptor 2 [Hypsibius exemplaris]|uniref:Fibroblast growth factor receptor 2 n=1 Tax=Hypsibius exemplaris TaxID=2072580 RepID=A0A9X6NLI0_HYPEX|nr:putative Fibroblast growth factor receptor 2 [Hypsibius exemplaris]